MMNIDIKQINGKSIEYISTEQELKDKLCNALSTDEKDKILILKENIELSENLLAINSREIYFVEGVVINTNGYSLYYDNASQMDENGLVFKSIRALFA